VTCATRGWLAATVLRDCTTRLDTSASPTNTSYFPLHPFSSPPATSSSSSALASIHIHRPNLSSTRQPSATATCSPIYYLNARVTFFPVGPFFLDGHVITGGHATDGTSLPPNRVVVRRVPRCLGVEREPTPGVASFHSYYL